MRLVALALAAMLLYQAPIERRPAPQQVPTIKVETRLVNVAVNVTDAHGAPVPGLTQGDFQISEDNHPQKIAFFEKESTTPLSIVLALDTSESIFNNERLEKEAAKHFVNAIVRDQDELDLMDFSDTVREIVPFTNQKKQIERGLNELQPGDETVLYDAIYLASQRLSQTRQDAGRRRVLVLITDGVDTKDTRYEQALEQAQRAGAMIYSLIIVPVQADAGRNTGGEHALIQMSEDTGGKYYYVEDPKALDAAFSHISDDLRTQYVLGYYAPQGVRNDQSLRTIGVKMNDAALRDKYSLRYRTGYYSDAR
ncbi:MAG TPA: VWA domain-containing protein [Edaphobacter sp.]|uniref:VWA domain-containing protein n=1 Tax=Edaphobacter sp. TaxID=1934404 RepID=UPI002D15C942|nr:VWA domain-containing protein [Edaphobacter sp.]HUZ94314.1 VWA domain-containing protein [Edaphobacter sp.]